MVLPFGPQPKYTHILKHATNLKVVGRAGIGTDNVDKGRVKTGCHCYEYTLWNMITTAEHILQ